MLITKIVRDKYGSYIAQHDEYKTDCYCSKCGEYLGSKDYTHSNDNSFGKDTRFCKFCGEPLYPLENTELIDNKSKIKITQGDKLRNMSDYELSKFLSDTFCHGYGQPQIKEWLEGEATHDHN